jgi:DNA primase small subunit
MFFDKHYMIRHRSFRDRRTLKNFLVSHVPKHAYYSTAYYKYPQIQDMEEKQWLGADLVFDLDADHIPETQGKRYEDMLKIVKREAEKLVFNFLLNDFGFDERDISIVFSGGRGYHIYVRSNEVYALGSDERREIVSYITGESIDFTKFLKRKEEKVGRKGKRIVYELYPPNFGGWYGKLPLEISRISQDLKNLYEKEGESAVIEELNSILQDKKLSKKIVRELFQENMKNTRKVEDLIDLHQSKKLQIFSKDTLRDAFLLYIKEKIRIRGEADEPVTTDIHRLIRLIGSLHGKTGFLVKNINLENFKDFNPLKDAIPEIFKNKEVKIYSKNPIEITLCNENYRIEGEDVVPEYVAIFFIARGMAEFISQQ